MQCYVMGLSGMELSVRVMMCMSKDGVTKSNNSTMDGVVRVIVVLWDSEV